MSMIDINWNPTRKDLRIFAALLIGFALLVGWWFSRHSSGANWPWILSGMLVVIGLVGVAAPPLIRWFYLGWMYAVTPIGWLISHLIMGLVYYGVFTPLGWVMRLRGYDPLQLKVDPDAQTYWQKRPETPPTERYFRRY